MNWYRKAAEQGYAKAQNGLGYMYDRGLGVSRDYTEAMRWCRKAADQGDASDGPLVAKSDVPASTMLARVVECRESDEWAARVAYLFL